MDCCDITKSNSACVPKDSVDCCRRPEPRPVIIGHVGTDIETSKTSDKTENAIILEESGEVVRNSASKKVEVKRVG
jgi:hypothetical protein